MSERSEVVRCGWVSEDPLYKHYHDTVWGRPETDPVQLYAKLCLDGQQAGLSWITILKKQANYEKAFHQFDPVKVARMTDLELEAQLQNPGIIRNKLKVWSIRKNARAFLAIQEKQSFTEFLWQFTNGQTIVNQWDTLAQVPVSTAESLAMSKALKKAGFSFVGETICYAFMQAVGMVNDHVTDCHCYEEVKGLARK